MAKNTDDIKAVVDSEPFNEMLNVFKKQRTKFIDDEFMFAHLNGIVQIGSALQNHLSPPTQSDKADGGS